MTGIEGIQNYVDSAITFSSAIVDGHYQSPFNDSITK